MTLTLTPRFGQPQWSSGADSPSRTVFNGAFAALDQKGALDPGTNGSALPSSDVVDGRYAHVVNGAYRQLYRRGGGAWAQVGGNMWDQTQYERAAAGTAQSASAVERSHPDLTNPTVVELWDGSSVRGGRFALGEVNPAVPSALHVGDTTSAVDLSVRGRVYARTTAANQRGFVASAHADTAGPLFTARTAGGDPWTVDAQGRMRAQVPAAFGAGMLTANVPVSVAPGTNDLSGVDLYAASGKPALRLFRAAGDATPIGLVEQDKITLGRSSWTGGVLEWRAPSINAIGAFKVTGASTLDGLSVLGNATVAGTLGVTGQSNLGTVQAGALTASSLASSGSLSAHNGLTSSAAVGSGAELRTRPATQITGTAQQSVRAPMVARVRDEVGQYCYNGGSLTVSTPVVMPEDGWMQVVAEVLVLADLGNGGQHETMRYYVKFTLYNAANTAVVSYPTGTGDDLRVETLSTDDTVRQIAGYTDTTFTEIMATRVSAGNYTMRAAFNVDSILGGQIVRIRYTTTAVVLHSSATV